MDDKISAQQLERAAYVYIRQSSLQQVRNNLESRRRQYALQDRARELGFREVVVIDDDLGISGAGHRERPGFGRLLTAVCDGRVGAVLAMEASRLARNNRDWHHLIDLCVLTQTLVVDAEGIYDPRLLNDRLLLGLKGTMSEFELGILRQRAQEAYRQKVLRGEVLTKVPIGFIRDQHSNRIEMTPDREVQEAIRNVFSHFERMGSLRQVLLWYCQENITFPHLHVSEGTQRVVWQLPNYQQLLRMLKNPTYAGAFAYGRTQCRSEIVEGRSRKSGGHRVAMENWQVLLKEHHAGYISWEQYLENQRILTSNRTKSHAVSCGAAKKGCALLTGLFRCARCGHKLMVAYRGRDGRAPRYYCRTGTEDSKPSCLCFAAFRVEKAVIELVLEACQPLGIEASLQALNAEGKEQGQKRRRLELALERVRYEAERAQRQYDAVDPGNRLVAAELEERWNAALVQVAEAESRLQSELQSETSLNEAQRNRLLRLGSNLNAAWNDVSVPIELKKRIIRTLIKEIVVDINHSSATLEMQIHWAGGVHTELKVRKNKMGHTANVTDQNVVDLVRALAMVQPDSYIAATLNRLGYHSGQQKTWNETRVKSLRNYNQIPICTKSCDRPWVTMEEAAGILKTSVTVIRTMIRKHLLPARQIVKHAPWTIRREDLQRPEVREYVKGARPGKHAPRSENNQPLIPNL